MLRYRRYRAFLLLTAVVIFFIYNISAKSSWRTGSLNSGSDANPFRNAQSNPQPQPASGANPDGGYTDPHGEHAHHDESHSKPDTKPDTKPEPPSSPADDVDQLAPKGPAPESGPSTTDDEPSGTTDAIPYVGGAISPIEDVMIEPGPGRFDVDPLPSNAQPIYWEPQPEKFPVSSTIQLPAGTPKAMPQIQFAFKQETAAEQQRREERLALVKDAMAHSWGGYKLKGMGHDEIRPVTGKVKDPFNGWGATLIDSLDTLWIMGMVDEFEGALEYVEKVNFKTSRRDDIPLFETTIRYLGGLLGAYDVSDGKYPMLLEKAVELAEVLMGAFDTPNRMPVPYYRWKPAFASQPHMSSTNIVLAEIGSLAVEFTRLAQLTKEHKYYDAIARITDALEDYQDRTRLPGLWPSRFDASGCKREYPSSPRTHVVRPAQPYPLGVDESVRLSHSNSMNSNVKPKDVEEKDDGKPESRLTFRPNFGVDRNAERAQKVKDDGSSSSSERSKRHLSVETIPQSGNTIPIKARPGGAQPAAAPECKPQGLESTSIFSSEEYTLAAMADSTYEYLPKMHLLLGGVTEQYSKMYAKAMDAVKDKLLFRPMLPNDDDVLISGTYTVSAQMRGDDLPPEHKGRHQPSGSHLNCFVGGMFAMGGKLFSRKEDVDIGAKLTEGCVWNYLSTSSGIMPESFIAIPCDSKTDCKWNETLWMDIIDPSAQDRVDAYEEQLAAYEKAISGMDDQDGDDGRADDRKTIAPAVPVHGSQAKRDANPQLMVPQVQDAVDDNGEESESRPLPGWRPTAVRPALTRPSPPLSHEEFVEIRMREERIPKGYAYIGDRRYLLRPEAIESVFYLYRITGDPKYRESGWKMFENVNQRTRTKLAAAAIDDVTKNNPMHRDEMESFWTAETLKYFYLLFASEDVISLDEWVFNTEAHPFKLPTVK